MFNGKICRDCDKIGNCNMKCAALKRLETPYVLIKTGGRGYGCVAEYERELLKQLERSKTLICAEDTKLEVIPCRSSGAAIAFDVCGKGRVLRDIAKIKQTSVGLIFIDSEGREMDLICVDDTKLEVIPYRSSGVAIAFDVCGRGQVLRDIVRIKQTEKELIFIDSEGRENHVATKLIDVMEVIA